MVSDRVISGMRPTGNLHLGHYHGVIKNWLEMQKEYDSYFFVADWHALTTHYQNTTNIEKYTKNLIIDWLSCGINPNTTTIFIQSEVMQHAQLHLLLSMITPVSWLERSPSYKDHQEKMSNKDLSTYGFLGYPLLQSADILLYKANLVPIGEDQVAHIELAREIARRFNYIYGKENDFEQKVTAAISRMNKKQAKIYKDLRKSYQEQGDLEVLSKAKAMLNEMPNISVGDKERLFGYLEGIGKTILIEPQPLLTKNSKIPGLDGQKMSKSYGNTISLRDSVSEVGNKIKRMPTDPSRIRISDPGDPSKCPVWDFHKLYTNDSTRKSLANACMKAEIGCIDCKQHAIKNINKELQPIQEEIKYYSSHDNVVEQIILDGNARAIEVAKNTMIDVNKAMKIEY